MGITTDVSTNSDAINVDNFAGIHLSKEDFLAQIAKRIDNSYNHDNLISVGELFESMHKVRS
jgi:hypothetical protein